MTASYYVSKWMVEPPFQLHKHSVPCYSTWLWQVSMIHYVYPLPSSPTSLFGIFRGMSGLAEWHSHSVNTVHSIKIWIWFPHPVFQYYVSVCTAVGCCAVVWYDAMFVAAKHLQVTGVFMWGLFALCGWYYLSGMLKQMHIYFKLCVFTVSSDNTFSLIQCIINKYVYTHLLIYSGTPNTMISIPPVYYIYI